MNEAGALERLARVAQRALSAPLAGILCRDGTAVVGWEPEIEVSSVVQVLRQVTDEDPVLVAEIEGDARFDGVGHLLPGVVALAAAPIRDAGGDPIGTILVMDRRPRPWSATESQTLRDLAALASGEGTAGETGTVEGGSMFLANLAHEVRTPLNAILGLAQVLRRDGRLLDDQREHVDVIHRSGEHLLRLVNDVIDFARTDAGRNDVRNGEVDLPSLLADLRGMFLVQAEAKGVAYAVEQDSPLPRRIITDEGKLRQILVNLIGNAIKFTREGSVRVQATTRIERAGARLIVDVSDTGHGVAPDLAGKLFKAFARGGSGPVAESSGLGLALSRDLARLLGGDVTLESTSAAGSVFRLELPIEIVSAETSHTVGGRGRVIGLVGVADLLVFDEDAVSRSWLRRLLQDCGFDVRETASLSGAVAALDHRRPDAVLMSVSVRRNGYGALREIRARGLPVVAFTASTSASAREQVLAEGADVCMSKPVHESDLLDALRTLLGVDYLYATPLRHTTLPPARWSPLPAEHVPSIVAAPLKTAARSADYQRLTELIDELPPEHRALAAELRRLAADYAYEQIEGRLSATIQNRSPA